ncbi:alpha/beta fold hydrolase [Marinobacter caseinilyticus]|uniref:alpha/beta fold hydrolase n=1 Tax=Marinobacter caseinilyticus TaxID=2692195 RepID=UPI001407B1CA|nr:alpha/beta hydrolase [Marinobacter caseinilyticus]
MHWILLRGLTREQTHWGNLCDRLADALPEHCFHPVDLPGTGVHYKERSPSTIAGIRRQVQRHVEHIPGPYGIIALSMGAMVALDWAQNARGGEIQQLVLINTSSGFSPPWRRMKPTALPRLLRLIAHHDVFHREVGILNLTSNKTATIATKKAWYSIQRQRPVSLTTALRQLVAAIRFRPAKQRPLPDALLLASLGDRIVDWRCSRTLERRWQWVLRVHAEAGHDLPLDDPAWVVERITEYLKG